MTEITEIQTFLYLRVFHLHYSEVLAFNIKKKCYGSGCWLHSESAFHKLHLFQWQLSFARWSTLKGNPFVRLEPL